MATAGLGDVIPFPGDHFQEIDNENRTFKFVTSYLAEEWATEHNAKLKPGRTGCRLPFHLESGRRL